MKRYFVAGETDEHTTYTNTTLPTTAPLWLDLNLTHRKFALISHT
jgi:hypothetical protein